MKRKLKLALTVSMCTALVFVPLGAQTLSKIKAGSKSLATVSDKASTLVEESTKFRHPAQKEIGMLVIPGSASGMSAMNAALNSTGDGNVFDVPYQSTFESTGLEGWTVIDANNDDQSWIVDGSEVRCPYNSSIPMDDWLISPGVQVESGKEYPVKIIARASTGAFPERVEVCVGKSVAADAMTTLVISPTTISSTPVTLEGKFTADESGVHYIGVHGISDADMAHLFITSVEIGMPEEVSDSQPPYQSDFAGTGLEGWIVIDANQDDKTWTVVDNEIRCSYNSSMAMDDWLISPVLSYEKGKKYPVSIVARVSSPSFPERLEVKAGKSATPEGMTNLVISASTLNKSEPTTLSGTFTPTETGEYYIGVHGISDADMAHLLVQSVYVGAGVVSEEPSAVTNLNVTPDSNAELSVEVSFTAPTTMIDGSELTAIDEIKVFRNDSEVKSFLNPEPGETLSFTDTPSAAGELTYSVVAYSNDSESSPALANCFVGHDLPAAPTNLIRTRTANTGEISLSWDAVSQDVRGINYKPGDVTYTVMEYRNNNWVTIEENITETSYTYTPVTSGQRFVQCGLYAVTNEGRAAATYNNIALGEPYVDFHESFANGNLSYNWAIEHIVYGYFDLFTDSSYYDMKSCDGDNGFMGIYGNLDCGLYAYTGLIDISNLDNPALTFYLNNMGGDEIDEVGMAVNVIDGANESGFITLAEGTIEALTGGNAGWYRCILPLTQVNGKVIQIRIMGVSRQYTYKYFDNIRVESIPTADLALQSITAPADVDCGSEYDVVAKVYNNGTTTLGNYDVTLLSDGVEADKINVSTDLEPGATARYSFRCTMSSIASQAVEHSVAVSVAGDEIADNNSLAQVRVTPVPAAHPSPANLEANNHNNGILLQWDAPDLSGEVRYPVTESFESGQPFSESFSGWTFVDVDDSAVGGFNDLAFPGITPGVTKSSFRIFDTETAGTNFTFNARTGNKYLFSLYRSDDGEADDWAISPLLSGSAQTISFYAASYDANWTEYIEVYYSTGSLDPTDFIKIEEAGGSVPGPTGITEQTFVQGWTQYTAALPDGAKYFAIRSCATGALMLMVDDARFIPAPGFFADETVRGYNVYRDGTKINESPITQTSFHDTDVEKGSEYSYLVTSLYDGDKESAPSEEVRIMHTDTFAEFAINDMPSVKTVTNGIIINNAANLEISVCSADGRIICNVSGKDHTFINVTPGIYIVKAGTESIKVLVK